jgi:integrase
MGSIRPYETKQGIRYEVRYRKPDRSEGGKRGFRRKVDAKEYLANVESAKSKGEYVDPREAKATIGELGSEWLGNQTHLKPSSFRPLEIAWRLYVEPRWGSVPAGQVRYSDVQSWVSEVSAKRSATTVLRAYGVLAGILDVAVKDRRLLTNPARGVKLPRKGRKPHRYLTHDEVSRLALSAGDKATLVMVLAYCGLRWGEATGLRVKDLDMLRRRINVTVNAVEVGDRIEVGTPKSHKARSVPFPELLAMPLSEACHGKGRDELVFSKAGEHLKRSHSDTGWFPRAVKAAGLGIMTPHSLRHTAASLAVASGANVKAVQRMLGHASASMTLDVYADLFDDDLDAVAGKLNEALSRTDVGKMWAEARIRPVDADAV